MKTEKLIIAIVGKFGYIGIGMFLAALFEYGVNRWIVAGLIVAISTVIVSYLGMDEEISFTVWEDDETKDDETI